ncbi:YncE family protein [Geofilum rhodophaeum]|uniref:YncE family protein n=1 Tax=Geofilum rhodophaeum TaxID=1965019 RepID=UPI000B521D3E|nr:DUF5074 domain-containing protein [Geofilum rhodophaeum]
MYAKNSFFDWSNKALWSLALLTALGLSACSDDNNDQPKQEINEEISGAYFLNFGSYDKGGSSITRYDFRKDALTNNYFEAQNPQMTIKSNIQYGAVYKDTIYLMGNSADELISVDLQFKPTGNAVREGIEKPRFFVGQGDYLYISCWGKDADFQEMPGSYIAIYNTKTRKVEDKIALPGGPEGLALANGKLYAALNYRPQVAVIDLNSEAIDYIDMPAVSAYFVNDADDNLYLALSSYDPTAETGLAYINTTTDELEDNYVLQGVSTTYASILTANSDASTLYLVAAVWGEPGSIFAFDTQTGEFSEFIDNLNGVNGIEINPFNKDIYVLQSGNVTEAGSVSIYNAEGAHQKDLNIGISPYWTLFLD